MRSPLGRRWSRERRYVTPGVAHGQGSGVVSAPPWRLAMTPARSCRRVLLAWLVLVGVVTPGASPPPDAHPATLGPHQRRRRERYQELGESNRTNSVGDNTKAAETIARPLLASGFPAPDLQALA